MSRPLHELVKFRGDKLFNGAVNIDWFSTDAVRSRVATESFVFHGPEYHGVKQADIGISHGHRLQDTASFARSIIRRCYGYEEAPFTLAIAGYGTGKSHLGLTLASLLSDPTGDAARVVLESIDAADPEIGRDIRTMLRDANQPCLVVALNGMQSFDLTNQVTQQVLRQLIHKGLDTKPIDELRPRFSQAASLVRMANQDVVQELLRECYTDSIDEVLTQLEQQDESSYRRIYDVFSRRGMILKALGGESVRDIVDTAARDFCGPDKPFRSLLVLFDEFGKYTEFATVKSQIAGSGVLQDLFEGVQSNSTSACFAGFIQFELNAYVQRIAPEYRNEILRYVTRYQTANRVYLSINMETLIANLIERRNGNDLSRWFDNVSAKQHSHDIMHDLAKWFPQSSNHRLWNDPEQFHAVVRKGCWPLSPYSTWFLFHLAAAGKHLQERSALALLGRLFDRFRDWQVSDDHVDTLSPSDFWSDELQQELITSEEGGHQGAITHAYASVIARHDASLPEDLKQLLRAVVLGSKMGLKAADRPDAVSGLAELAGVTYHDADSGLRLLEEEFNVLEWDAAFKQFDILGDAVPRTQFLSWLRQRVASTYDDAGKAALFSSKGQQWCDLLGDLDCDFAEENKITTREWRYQAVTSSLDNLPMNVKLAADRWQNALAVDEPRGTLIYCYVGPGRDVASIEQDASRVLRAAAKSVNVPATPTLVVLLSDEDGMCGQAIAELAVLQESVSGEDRARFGNLIPAHVERQQELVRSKVEAMIRQRRYVTPFREATEARRLSQVGSELFSRIYKTPITFPFDGFSTARGNAADSCQELTRELLLGTLDYDAVMGKPIKVKNRAIAVLNDGWGIFSQNGKVLTRPKHLAVRNLTTKWDDLLANGERRLRVAEAIQSLCLPPYGANIASAALVLSAFVAPRVDKLMVVRDGQQCAVSQWLQDGLFKGKYIDLNSLRGVDFVSIGEASSEWEVLLDEWEQAESLLVRVQCFERAEALRERVPVPPVLHWRVVHLQDLAKKAITTLADMERRQNDALSKIESGYERTNLGLVIWGAATLQEMCDRMRSESTLWHDRQIEQLTPHVERARQEIIQGFSDWLVRQSPRDDSPDTVGEFKHKMLHLTGANLKKLKLEDQCSLLEKHVIQIVKNVETAVEAKQLVRTVRSWLTMHGDAQRSVRVAESRDLLDVGKDLGNKLQGIALRIALPELGEVRTELSEALARIKQAVEKQLKRATRLWNVRLSSIDDVESSLEEIDALVAAFEGCSNDLNDLHLMRRALRLYYEDNKQLSDERLTWREFESLTEDLRKRASDIIGESDTPWPPSEVFETLASNISKCRKQRSTEWIDSIEQASSGVEAMSASDANRLHERATAPPAVLTEPHTKRLDKVLKQIEKRLDALKLEWLVEKFRELDAPLRKQFLKLVEEM